MIKIAKLTDVQPNKMFRASHNNREYLLANINGEIYAMDNTCSHEDASLYNGALKGHCVECPLHGSLFDFRNGQPDGNPATVAINTYPVTIKDNEIYIEI